MTITEFLDRFDGHTQAGHTYKVCCPAHNDVRASLAVKRADNGGVVLYCHAGCQTRDIVRALGLTMRDLMPPQPDRPTIVATYDYRLIDGTLEFQTIRKSDKSFLQRRPDGQGGWIWKLGRRIRRVPYRLPDLVGHETVYIVEGEKDANNLWTIGVPATCNAGGAGKWGVTETRMLVQAGVRRVIVIPDNDRKGLDHAEDVATKCRNAGLSARLLQLDGLPERGDVTDWLEQGHTRADLEALAAMHVVASRPAAGQTAAGAPIGTLDAGRQGPEAEDDQTAASMAELGPDGLPDPTAYATEGADGVPHDVGAARAFVARFGDRVRFDHAMNRWLIWNGHRWREDVDGAIVRLAVRHADLWQREAQRCVTYLWQKQLIKFVIGLHRRQSIDNMLKLAATHEGVSTNGRQWDTDPWVLGVENGVIDLRTGERRDGRREDWIAKSAGAAFDPNAECPRWMQFLDEIMCGDRALVDYLHRAIGYSLTGDMREQCFFLCIGAGANGKSILLDTLETVWGDYAHRANMRVFIGGHDDAKFHLAEFASRRLVIASETKPNTRINEDVIKNWTGGESQSAERKFGQPFTFQPIGKIWLSANHHPRVIDDSYGFWRRVRMVPFDQTFTGTLEDRSLRARLAAEAPGILAWAVRGCLRWQAEGLQPPAQIVTATEEYQTSEDPLLEFFTERTVVGDSGDSETLSALYAAYDSWCDVVRIDRRGRLSRRAMENNLRRRFASSNDDGILRFSGLRIKPGREAPNMLDYGNDERGS